MKNFDLKNIVELHVHSSPDIRARAYTDIELLDAGVRVGAKAIVIKSHHGTTMDRAFLANEYNKKVNGNNGFTMYGGIVLNYAVGGLNPVAVETALKLGAKIVWLPTIHAANQIKKFGGTGGISCVENGRPVENLIKIMDLVKEYDVTFATGHLDPEEIFIVVKHAREMGITKIVINHPEFWIVGLSIEQQITLAKEYDVYLERCYAQPMGGGEYKSNLEDNYQLIKEIGPDNIIINTDGGQVENPLWEDAFQESINYLLDKGISKEDVYKMTRTNPAKALGINI
jgi:predicted metal-dependent TIM-barrel fold hydrolase